VLLEEPPTVQPIKNFPAFYGTRRFNTVFTRALHWSLCLAISIHTILSYLSKIHFNIVHPPTSWFSQWSLSFWLSHQYVFLLSPIRATCSATYNLQKSRYTVFRQFVNMSPNCRRIFQRNSVFSRNKLTGRNASQLGAILS
jgi:hypothetical protein